MAINQFSEIAPWGNSYGIAVADGTNVIGLTGPSSQDYRWDNIYLTNQDGVDHVVNVYLSTNTGPWLLGSVNVPNGAGIAGNPTVDVLAGIAALGGNGVALRTADVLSLGLAVAATTDFTVAWNALGGIL